MDVAALITDLQSRGLRVEAPVERRSGGAGPSDSGLLWIEGVAVTVPTGTAWADASPYLLREEDQGYGIYRDGERLAGAAATAGESGRGRGRHSHCQGRRPDG